MKKEIKENREYMTAVVQIYVEGFVGEDIKSILNPRLGDLKEWTGSGFFVASKFGDDLIVTNAHVVKNAKSIEIMSMLTSEEKFEAEVVEIVKNQEPDIAIIKLKDGALERFKQMALTQINYLPLSTKSEISRGTAVRAIGYPMGMTEPNITSGEVTNFVSGDRITAEKYVTDAAINPGNSGGPAINASGEVIGINTSIYKDAENIGFITPSSFIHIILNYTFDTKNNAFSEIGVNFQRNSSAYAQYLNLENNNGVIAANIEKGAFFENIGGKQHDILLAINDIYFDRHGICIDTQGFHRKNLFDLFKLIPIGEKAKLLVLRGNKKILLEGETIGRPKKYIKSVPLINERAFLDLWGLTIQTMSYEIVEALGVIDPEIFFSLMRKFDDTKTSLIVTHIKKGSPAYLQEWSIGEVIGSYNGIVPTDLEHLKELVLEEKNETTKLLSRNGMIGYFSKDGIDKDFKVLKPECFLE